MKFRHLEYFVATAEELNRREFYGVPQEIPENLLKADWIILDKSDA